MKKTVLLILSLMILLFPTGCTTYSSSYKAIGFVHSNTSDHAEMSFYSFEGKMVFRLKSAGEGDLKFKANLESGTATVYYDYNGIKSELFSIGPGEELDAHGGYVESGTVYIIVETDGKCMNGDFSFSLD